MKTTFEMPLIPTNLFALLYVYHNSVVVCIFLINVIVECMCLVVCACVISSVRKLELFSLRIDLRYEQPNAHCTHDVVLSFHLMLMRKSTPVCRVMYRLPPRRVAKYILTFILTYPIPISFYTLFRSISSSISFTCSSVKVFS